MNTEIIAQTESTLNTLFTLCCIETVVLSIVAGYFGWKLYGWLEEKITDYQRSKKAEFEHITLKGGNSHDKREEQKDEVN